MQFIKMHSHGNDFVVFGSPTENSLPDVALIRLLCDRHYGVGADCSIFIGASDTQDYYMHVYNPNGFEAEMCGNALRCSARYVYECGYFTKRSLTAETKSGPRSLIVNDDSIHTEIGKAHIIQKGEIELYGISLPYIFLSMGNPHCVVFVSQLSDNDFSLFGPAIETNSIFPEGTNVEFARVIDRNNIAMRVWERGIGETLSCVTGSCAVVAAAIKSNLCSGIVKVHQSGGCVEVETKECGNMLVTGNCTIVFKGKLL